MIVGAHLALARFSAEISTDTCSVLNVCLFLPSQGTTGNCFVRNSTKALAAFKLSNEGRDRQTAILAKMWKLGELCVRIGMVCSSERSVDLFGICPMRG